jgi:predicted Zn-ribbon and HTH transcriptional regulator
VSVTNAIAGLKKALKRKGYDVIVTPRAALDWPCVHCGKKLSECKKLGGCCRRCKGKKDNFRTH